MESKVDIAASWRKFVFCSFVVAILFNFLKTFSYNKVHLSNYVFSIISKPTCRLFSRVPQENQGG